MVTSTTRKFIFYLGMLIASLYENKKLRKYLWLVFLILFLGFLIPQNLIIPVEGATEKDWDKKSFWAYPWGTSITHKGIDIFHPKGAKVISSSHGIVVYTANSEKGGKSVMILGPRWKFYYYAHMNNISTFTFKPIKRGEKIGTVGDTGNAKGKPPHLHFSIVSPFPYLHHWDNKSPQGWKKSFFMNPDAYFRLK